MNAQVDQLAEQLLDRESFLAGDGDQTRADFGSVFALHFLLALVRLCDEFRQLLGGQRIKVELHGHDDPCANTAGRTLPASPQARRGRACPVLIPEPRFCAKTD